MFTGIPDNYILNGLRSKRRHFDLEGYDDRYNTPKPCRGSMTQLPQVYSGAQGNTNSGAQGDTNSGEERGKVRFDSQEVVEKPKLKNPSQFLSCQTTMCSIKCTV